MTEQTTACWHIWSGEHHAWWRRGESGQGEGYVSFLGKAGKWTRAEAEAMTRHCGPEKKVDLVPDPYGPDAEAQHDGRHFISQRARRVQMESDPTQTTEDAFTAAYKADMWRVDVAGYPISVRGQVARAHLEELNRSYAQMKLALHKIAKLAEHPGGAGQIARDVLRVCK